MTSMLSRYDRIDIRARAPSAAAAAAAVDCHMASGVSDLSNRYRSVMVRSEVIPLRVRVYT
jgi:hypothetical protein